MSKTIVTLTLFQLAVSAKDYDPDGAPYATQAEAEVAKVEMARERMAGRFVEPYELHMALEEAGLTGEVENIDTVEDIDVLSDAVVVKLAEQNIDFQAAIYSTTVDMVIEDVEAAIIASGVITEDRDDLAEGLAAAYGVVQSWEQGDLAGAVGGLEGWYDGVVARLPDLACADDEDGDEDDAEQGDTKGWEKGDRCDVPTEGDRGEILSFMSEPGADGYAIAVVDLDFGGQERVLVSVNKLDILYDEPDAARPY